MTRIALVSSESLRPRMAGIGIRYLEMAKRLPQAGFEVTVMCPGELDDVQEVTEGMGVQPVLFERGALKSLLGDADVVVAQGQLANDVVLELPNAPVVIDLYDPWLIENLHYTETLGLDPYRNDHATWMLQLSRGDFFLCSSAEQRLYYLGLLTALGRINPVRVVEDPSARELLAICPFGVPQSLEAHEPWLEPGDTPRILFGGLYDWYDPLCLLEALGQLGDLAWQLLFVRSPNASGTPQEKLLEVEAECKRRDWLGSRVDFIDWVPFERRYDLLRDVSLLATTHQPSIETDLSLRTRFLDALVAGVPVLTSSGGSMSRLLTEHRAGWVVPPGEPAELGAALREILTDAEEVKSRVDAGAELVTGFSWEQVLEPLVEFCREPKVDATKEEFAFAPGTRAPDDPLDFRVKRRLKRMWSGS